MKKVCIIGAGPAGISCAIQLKRMGINAVVFEKNRIGGLLHEAGRISNYPGFDKPVKAKKLISRMVRHLEEMEIQIKNLKITGVEHNGSIFRLYTGKKQFTCDVLVIASGTIPVEQNFNSEHIIYGVSGIRKMAGMEIAIVGAGDAAFDYALQLYKKNNVSVFNRSGRIKALKALQDEFFRKEDIRYMEDFILKDVVEEESKLYLTFKHEKESKVFSADYLIFATGRQPSMDMLRADIKENMESFISEKRLFLIGDVKNGRYRQTGIAVGDGIRAGMEIAG